MRPLAWIGVLLASCACVQSAWADRTVTCMKPPDNEARVAVKDNVAVGFTQDESKRSCTFSIDGAKAASPSAELIRKGFNALRAGAPIVNELRNKQVDNLANALLATASVAEIPPDFRAMLSQSAQQLSDCLGTFFEKGDAPSALGKTDTPVTCRLASKELVRSEKAHDILEIVVTWGDKRYVTGLYIPRSYRTLPPME